jgi:hypothetical protein
MRGLFFASFDFIHVSPVFTTREFDGYNEWVVWGYEKRNVRSFFESLYTVIELVFWELEYDLIVNL